MRSGDVGVGASKIGRTKRPFVRRPDLSESRCRRAGHGRRVHRVHDAPAFGTPVVVLWRKRIWRCADPGCAVRTFSETHPLIPARAKFTARAVAWTTGALAHHDTTVSTLARHAGVDWHTWWTRSRPRRPGAQPTARSERWPFRRITAATRDHDGAHAAPADSRADHTKAGASRGRAGRATSAPGPRALLRRCAGSASRRDGRLRRRAHPVPARVLGRP